MLSKVVVFQILSLKNSTHFDSVKQFQLEMINKFSNRFSSFKTIGKFFFFKPREFKLSIRVESGEARNLQVGGHVTIFQFLGEPVPNVFVFLLRNCVFAILY